MKIKNKKLSKLISGIKYKVLSGNADVQIKGVAEGANTLKKGELFICVKGYSKDGHDFVAEAEKKGAAAIIVEHPISVNGKATIIQVSDSKKVMQDITDKFYADAKKNVKIYGITGTKGKTTVSYIVEAMLKEKTGKDCAVIGTIGFKIGKKIYSAENTTPSNIKIHRLIAEAASKGIKHVIIEASSHALDQERLANISFDSVAMTNVTRDHFDYHKNFKNYLNAKLKIVEVNLKKGGKLAVNTDSKGAEEFIKAGKNKKAKILTYSWKGKTDIKLNSYNLDIKGMDFEIEDFGKKVVFYSSLVGEHNIYNVMTALGLVHGEVDLKTAAKAVHKFKTVKGRLEKVYSGDFTVLVDFAHTTDSIEKILFTLNELKKSRIITVFGAGGDRDKGKRPMMGEAANRLSDVVIVTSDNPRTENPTEIIKEIMVGINDKSKTIVIEDRKEAINHAIKIAKKDDIIFIAGKGHEEYQIIGETKFPFSDQKVVREAIKNIK